MKKLILSAILAVALVLPSVAQVMTYVPYRGDLLANNGTVNVPLSGSTNLPNPKVIALRRGQPLALFPSFNLHNSAGSVSNVTFNFAVGPGVYTNQNGTVFGATNMTTTTTNYSVTLPLNGSTNQVGYYLIPINTIEAGTFQLLSISTTATNVGGVDVSNCWYYFTIPQP